MTRQQEAALHQIEQKHRDFQKLLDVLFLDPINYADAQIYLQKAVNAAKKGVASW